MGKKGKKRFDKDGKLISADSFVCYKTWYESMQYVPEDNQLELFRSIFDYGFYGKEPVEDASTIVKVLFPNIKYAIDEQVNNYKHGCNGGRPLKNKPNEEVAEPNEEDAVEGGRFVHYAIENNLIK